jgi:tetratricopeptide (TPR) repeat protein
MKLASSFLSFWFLFGSGFVLAEEGLSEIPVEYQKVLFEAQNASANLEFLKAEELAYQAVNSSPSHPLPRIFLVSTLLYEIQENIDTNRKDPRKIKRIFEELEKTINLCLELRKKNPGESEIDLYLGGALGIRGLVNLYEGNLITSYFDGKNAVKALNEALRKNPELIDAYLGLGQFEYYCSKFSGVLRFFLFLSGDENKALKWLELASAEGVYSALPAKIFLSTIYTNHKKNLSKALPYVNEIYFLYPESFYHVQYTLNLSELAGLDTDLGAELAEKVFKRWDLGWRPPEYVNLEIEEKRMKLAEKLLNRGLNEKARFHFRELKKSKNEKISAQASAFLRNF